MATITEKRTDRERAIELGVSALRNRHATSWAFGDSLILFGWAPSAVGQNNGTYLLIDEYKECVADAAGLDPAELPSQNSLAVCALAAHSLPKNHRSGVSATAAALGQRAINTGAYDGTLLDLLEDVRQRDGRITTDGVAELTGHRQKRPYLSRPGRSVVTSFHGGVGLIRASIRRFKKKPELEPYERRQLEEDLLELEDLLDEINELLG